MNTNEDSERPDEADRPNPVDYEGRFVRAMKTARERGDLSQSALALNLILWEDLSLDATAITRIERGDRRIRLNEAVAIAHVLDIDLNDAVGPGLDVDLEEVLAEAERRLSEADGAAAYWSTEKARRARRVQDLRVELQGARHGVDPETS